ncbi:DUF5681 domain-containing protein [Sphingomonas sp. RT2P30]|uniref:DUF5681 domain-containing protein n=1 Tax=Parasphingomonas halimpatiens TaxID=3096162 RepID=UPI002FC9AC65
MEYDESESACARDAQEAAVGDAAAAHANAPVSRKGGTPPPAQRWRKGQSGNPAGRPPKARASGSRGDRLLGADEPTRTMILTHAYALVSFKEDGVTHEMPLNAAVWRAMGRAALSGNRLAQYRFTQIVRETEREQLAAQAAIYNALERNHYRRSPDASFDDDLIMDLTTGTVVVRGDGVG